MNNKTSLSGLTKHHICCRAKELEYIAHWVGLGQGNLKAQVIRMQIKLDEIRHYVEVKRAIEELE